MLSSEWRNFLSYKNRAKLLEKLRPFFVSHKSRVPENHIMQMDFLSDNARRPAGYNQSPGHRLQYT